LLSLQGVGSCSLPNYGGVGLDFVTGHAGAHTGPREPRVHDGGGACDLSCDRAAHFPYARGHTWWPMWHSMSDGLVCHDTDSSALCCSIMA
jgi:hypothetical protein